MYKTFQLYTAYRYGLMKVNLEEDTAFLLRDAEKRKFKLKKKENTGMLPPVKVLVEILKKNSHEGQNEYILINGRS